MANETTMATEEALDVIRDSTVKEQLIPALQKNTEVAGKMLEEMRNNNAFMEILALDKIKEITSDWEGLEHLANTGKFGSVFGVGDQFIDTWKDTATDKEYTYPWQLNHVKDVELEDGEILKERPLIASHYAHAIGVQFSHQRAFLACPDGLAPGTYYFTIETKWGDRGYVLAGDVVAFTITQPVPVGGKVSGCYGAPDNAKSTWKIYTHSADGKEVIETVTPTFGVPNSGTSLGTLKHNTRNGNLNSAQEMAYGWNRWKTSALRQYLNSDKGVGEWWTAQDEWDIAPDQLTQKAGFLSGLPEKLVNLMKTTKITTYANTVQDGGEADITYDKVFIPSLEEIHVVPQISGEGTVHEYYLRKSGSVEPLKQYGTYPNMIHYAAENHSSPQYVRLRSAYRGNACGTWYVSPSGYVYNNNASWASRFCPAWIL